MKYATNSRIINTRKLSFKTRFLSPKIFERSEYLYVIWGFMVRISLKCSEFFSFFGMRKRVWILLVKTLNVDYFYDNF